MYIEIRDNVGPQNNLPKRVRAQPITSPLREILPNPSKFSSNMLWLYYWQFGIRGCFDDAKGGRVETLFFREKSMFLFGSF